MSNQDPPIDLDEPFILGNITIDPANVQLSLGQQHLSCEPKVFEILLYFCAHSQQLVSREQLLAQLWQGRTVSDNAINRKIYQLRKLLQSLDNRLEYIETVPKHGYRLIQTPTITKTTAQKANEHPNDILHINPKRLLNQWWLAPLLLMFMLIWYNQIEFKNDIIQPQLQPLTSPIPNNGAFSL